MNAIYACSQKIWNSSLPGLTGTIAANIATIWASSKMINSPLSSAGVWAYGATNSIRKIIEYRADQILSHGVFLSLYGTAICSTTSKVISFALFSFISKLLVNTYFNHSNCETARTSNLCQEVFSQEDSLKLSGLSEVMQITLTFSYYYLKKKYNFCRNLPSNEVFYGCCLTNGDPCIGFPFPTLNEEEREEILRDWFLHSHPNLPPGRMSEMCSALLARENLLKELFPQIHKTLLPELFDRALSQKNDAKALCFLQLASQHTPDLFDLDTPIGAGATPYALNPLHQALNFGLDESALFLIPFLIKKRGSSAVDIIETPTSMGSTALHIAVRRRCVKATELLLSLGANPHWVDGKGLTSIQWALQLRPSSEPLLNMLCSRERLSFVTKEGNTILHLAAQNCFANTLFLEQWIDAELNPLQKNKKGETPLSLAIERKAIHCIFVFFKHVAKKKTLWELQEYYALAEKSEMLVILSEAQRQVEIERTVRKSDQCQSRKLQKQRQLPESEEKIDVIII